MKKPKLSPAEKFFLNMLADRLEQITKDKNALKPQNEGSGSTLKYEDAVEKVTSRLKGAQKGFKRNEPGAQLLEGQFEAAKHVGSGQSWDHQTISTLIEEANKDYSSFMALKFILQVTPTHFQPDNLRNWSHSLYLGIAVPPKKPTGKFQYANLYRDLLVVRQVKNLIETGFSPTRNKASVERCSACDVVAEALSASGQAISYDAVETIWNNRNKFPQVPLLEGYLKKILEDPQGQ